MKKLFVGAVIVILFFAGYTLIKDYQYNQQILENVIKNIPESVSVADQKLFNDNVIIENRVSVSSVNLAWPGYVAVYENPNDKFGTLVGTSRFLSAGEHKDVPVDLVKSYKPGTRLYAILHRDDGDGIFNLVQDFPVEKNHSDVIASFVIKGE